MNEMIHDPQHRVKMASQFLILIGIFILNAGIIFPFIGMGILTQLTGHELSFLLQNLFSNPELVNGGREALQFIQAFSSIGGFIFSAFIFFKLFSYPVFDFMDLTVKKVNPAKSVIVVLIAWVIIPLISLLGALNLQLPLPSNEALAALLQNSEEQRRKMVEFFLETDSTTGLIRNLLLMAIVPAIAEEVFFRGLLQNFFRKWFRNPWIAIFLTAFIFSALHFRYFQFLPIFAAGLFFGWIFYKTGNLLYTIICHAVYNGTLVTLSHYKTQLGIEKLIEDESVPGMELLIPSLLLFGILIYFLMQFSPPEKRLDTTNE
jgi:uncharacterized protein